MNPKDDHKEKLNAQRFSLNLEAVARDIKETSESEKASKEISYVFNWSNLQVQAKIIVLKPVDLTNVNYRMSMDLGTYPSGTCLEYTSYNGEDRSITLPFQDIRYDGCNEIYIKSPITNGEDVVSQLYRLLFVIFWFTIKMDIYRSSIVHHIVLYFCCRLFVFFFSNFCILKCCYGRNL